MELSQDHISQLKDWVNEGNTLSSIQKNIEQHWGTRLTYMEVRFLIDDYDLQLVDSTSKEKEAPPGENAAPEEPILMQSGVTVSVDKVMRPGTIVSGSATFSDGESAPWHLDQMGRIALNPSKEGYRPPEQDMADFQQKLQEELQKAGY